MNRRIKLLSLKIWYQLIVFFIVGNTYSQSYLISFPQPPSEVKVCSVGTELYVRIDVVTATSSGLDISIDFPEGFSYVSGSVIKIGGTPALNISENGGTTNTPLFFVSPNNLSFGDFIEFSVKRRADCVVHDNAIAGNIFQDSITVSSGGNPNSEDSPPYNVIYPTLSFTQPDIIENVVIGNTYTRTFTITNGSDGCAEAVYFSLEYPNAEVTQQSLFLDGNPITPVSTIGNTSYYTIIGSDLTADQLLCNGESITFTETITVDSCDYADTIYKVGWGCSSNPADWCQIANGLGSFSL